MILLKKIKLVFITLLVFVVVISMSSCYYNQNKNNLKKIKISEATRSIFYAPQYVAISLGLFEKEGLEIELTTSEGSDKAMTAVLSKHSDIGLMGSEMIAYVYNEGKENFPIIFSQLTKRDGSFIVGRDENFSWDSLKGKSVISGRKGGLPEMVFKHVLKKNGIIPNKDVKLLNNIKFELMGGAFLGGVGDYVTLFEPIASSFEHEKNCKVLKSVGSECGEITYTCYCSSQDYIKNNKETIKKFTKALYKSQIWIHQHDSKEVAERILPYFVNIDKSLLEESLERCVKVDVWSRTPVIKKEDFDLMQEIAIEASELKTKVDFNKIVDNQYAFEATL